MAVGSAVTPVHEVVTEESAVTLGGKSVQSETTGLSTSQRSRTNVLLMLSLIFFKLYEQKYVWKLTSWDMTEQNECVFVVCWY